MFPKVINSPSWSKRFGIEDNYINKYNIFVEFQRLWSGKYVFVFTNMSNRILSLEQGNKFIDEQDISNILIIRF